MERPSDDDINGRGTERERIANRSRDKISLNLSLFLFDATLCGTRLVFFHASKSGSLNLETRTRISTHVLNCIVVGETNGYRPNVQFVSNARTFRTPSRQTLAEADNLIKFCRETNLPQSHPLMRF